MGSIMVNIGSCRLRLQNRNGTKGREKAMSTVLKTVRKQFKAQHIRRGLTRCPDGDPVVCGHVEEALEDEGEQDEHSHGPAAGRLDPLPVHGPSDGARLPLLVRHQLGRFLRQQPRPRTLPLCTR